MKKAILITLGLSVGLVSAYGQKKTPPTSTELINKMDGNEDGKLSKEEVKGPLAKDFETVDVNKDGFLTKTELDGFKPEKGKKSQKEGKAKSEMDTDGDGKISKSEAKGRLSENFDSIDTDKDGFLSKEEMKAHKANKMK